MKGVTDPDDIMSYGFYMTHLEESKKTLQEGIKDYVVNGKEDVKIRTNYRSFYHNYNICNAEYISEVRFLIHFLLELMVLSYHTVIEQRMRLINFVQNDRSKLFSQKIFIILETGQ